MTTQELEQLAKEHADWIHSFNADTPAQLEITKQDYKAGFKKALELVTKLLDESNNANSYLKQEFVKEFFYFV